MTMLNDQDIGSGSVHSPRTSSASTTTTTGTATSMRSATWRTRAASTAGYRTPTSPPTAPSPVRSTSSRTAWSVAACCSTCRALRGVRVARAGRGRVPSRDLEAAEHGGGRERRRPATSSWSARAIRDGVCASFDAVGHRPMAKAGLHPTAAGRRSSWPTAIGRRARVGREQRHGPEHDRRASRSRSTCWRSTRWGCTCSTTSSSRRSPGCANRSGALGVPVRGRAPAGRARDGLAAETRSPIF